MDREQKIGKMAQFFPRTKRGHGGLSECRMGCDLGTEQGEKKHNQDKYTMAERFVNTGTTERPAHRKDTRGANDLSAERWGFREQGVIHAFTPGDLIQIEIPFLAQKHGALEEPENKLLHGAMRQVLPTPPNASRYERLVTVKIGKDKIIGIPAVWCHMVKPVASA